MSNRILLAALVVTLLAVTPGCGDRSQGAQGNSAALQGKVFLSTAVTEQGKPRPLVDGTSVELSFTDDGRLNARAGCNMMQAPVTLDGGKIAAAELAITQMGCPNPDLYAQDEWLAKFLTAKPSWRMDGTNLVVTGADSEIVLSAEAPATLEGGEWKLNGLLQGETASSIPGDVRATVKFANGKVEVFAGCNSGGGAYKVDGQMITFEPLVYTDKACGENEMIVEKAVLAALKDKIAYKIDRSTLTLTNGNGDGVQLKK
ncbi:META domain-containing protein [Lentzea sp. NPDC051213]|uniref:META domain-containing protein n=1 Tax=Lentzea sp. NPDC051213 TaxID=3364126 RepID=UPI0037989BA7